MAWYMRPDRTWLKPHLGAAGAQNDKSCFSDFCICIHGRVVGQVGVWGKIMGEVQGVTDYVFRCLYENCREQCTSVLQ